MQNRIGKALYLLLITLFFINISLACAAPQEISAEGEYRLGDTDTRDNAKKMALSDAKRKIIEQAGVIVESYTEVKNFQVTQDQIHTTAAAMIKVKFEKIDFYENGTVCKAFVVAVVDTDDIEKYFKKSNTVNIDSKNNEKYKEFNGHYYKLYNEGMIWQDAKSYCDNIGGHLATITSKNEQEFINSLLINGLKGCYWIGGYKYMNQWKWVTNESFNYTNWGPGEPNDYRGETNIMIFQCQPPNAMSQRGQWNDENYLGKDGFYGISNFGFICEWDSYEAISPNL